MKDLEIIKRIEFLLKIKLVKGDNVFSYLKCFTLHEDVGIEGISLSNCKISHLDRIVPILKELKYLKYLNLSHNNIQNINALQELNGLTDLTLQENNLIHINPLNQLPNLTALNLRRNSIRNTTPLKELLKLENLDLGLNSIINIAPLEGLMNLTTLDIRSNSIEDIAPLKGLKNLRRLNLSGNLNKDIIPIGELLNLTELDLSNNEFASNFNYSILSGMKNLTKLTLSRNKLIDIKGFSGMKQLTYLDVSHNLIQNIAPLANLIDLKFLSLFVNKVKTLSPLATLLQIETLHLSSNFVEDISPLKELTELRKLGLWDNKVKDITPLKNLKKLHTLYLWDNPIKELPSWITDFDMDIQWKESGDEEFITFFNNPFERPPAEIVRQGKNAIKRYFDKIYKEGIDYIYEAKLTLVGEGSAGKTSLQRRLINEKMALPRKDKRTRGIEISDWQFKKEKNKKHIAHIWDFGGQDVYYPVHRFFITENSVFVLLASTRQTHHNFDYWIPTIYQFGGKSPIILGQTCNSGNKISWNDLGVYLSNPNFNIIKTNLLPYNEINLLNNNEGLRSIKQIIIDQIVNLPHYGKGVPKSWVLVRNAIAEESYQSSCISFDVFKEICKRSSPESFIELTSIKDCGQFLHDIGVVLWYSGNEDLKNWVILQPEWAMNAVYIIIDDNEIQARRGNIISKDFKRLWLDDSYKDRHSILKKMLEVFKIAFPKKHKQEDYIIPARLLSMPNEYKWPDNQPYLRVEYRFEFMPRGVVNQMSAELSRYIASDIEVWNNAVNFKLENNSAECQVEEDFYNRKIGIKTKGKDARGLIILVMDALKNITDGYKGVKPQIYVPCICSVCFKSNSPEKFYYDKLLDWSAKRENASVICNESGERLLIEDMLYKVGLEIASKKEILKGRTKKIEIFLASSSELKEDRREFREFISVENDRLSAEGIYIKVIQWEYFLDSMSETRLQDEYNKAVKDCDIFISLFFTKVGKYTNEEFETAYGQFIKAKKPKVYTYFKHSDINTNEIKKENVDSVYTFEKKLKSLEHFPTSYKNMDELKYKFKLQLEKIIENL